MEENIEEPVYTDQQYYESIETSQQDEYHEQKSPLREQDRFLPIANVAKIMKKAVPTNGKIAKESKECVQECVSEFISFITSEAADRCHQEKRKTVNGEDLLFAINSLGFDNYVEPLKKFLNKFRESSKLDSAMLDDSNLGTLTNNPSAPMTAVFLNIQGTPITLQTTTNANGQTVITSTAQQANGEIDQNSIQQQQQGQQTILISNGGDDANGQPQQIFITTANGQTRLATAETLQQFAGSNQQIILNSGGAEGGKVDEDVKMPQNTIFLPISLVNGGQVTTAVTQASNEN